MRNKMLTVVDFPALGDRAHRCRIVACESGHRELKVSLGLLSPTQLGRTITVHLPLPLRPQGPTIDLFTACGFPLQIGQKISVTRIVGKELLCKFKQHEEGTFEIVTCQSIPTKENPDAPTRVQDIGHSATEG